MKGNEEKSSGQDKRKGHKSAIGQRPKVKKWLEIGEQEHFWNILG